MARVTKAKAGKDYPSIGVKKGEDYYHWAFFRGPKQMSKTPPKRSQLIASPTLSAAVACEEDYDNALGEAKTLEDICSAIDDAVSAADSAIGDFEEAIGNLEQAFQGGCPALDEKQEQRDALESWKDELENFKSDIEGIEGYEHFDDFNEEKQQEMLDEALEIARSTSLEV